LLKFVYFDTFCPIVFYSVISCRSSSVRKCRRKRRTFCCPSRTQCTFWCGTGMCVHLMQPTFLSVFKELVVLYWFFFSI